LGLSLIEWVSSYLFLLFRNVFKQIFNLAIKAGAQSIQYINHFMLSDAGNLKGWFYHPY